MALRRYNLFCQHGQDGKVELISRHWTRRGAENKANFMTNYPEEIAYVLASLPEKYRPRYYVRERF